MIPFYASSCYLTVPQKWELKKNPWWQRPLTQFTSNSRLRLERNWLLLKRNVCSIRNWGRKLLPSSNFKTLKSCYETVRFKTLTYSERWRHLEMRNRGWMTQLVGWKRVAKWPRRRSWQKRGYEWSRWTVWVLCNQMWLYFYFAFIGCPIRQSSWRRWMRSLVWAVWLSKSLRRKRGCVSLLLLFAGLQSAINRSILCSHS